MEEAMRRFILSVAAAAAMLAAGAFAPDRAEAMALSTPAGIQAAVDGTSLAQDVAYVCRRVWRCGPYGCGWRRYCYHTHRYYGSPYYGRPYYNGRYYRHRYYRY
jgi:hypothetical protein